ncbi:sigma-70 family RNA polymerase sigma factor [Fulvivirgaceae bacterium BMA12]|uniref:Sigma-70 family RNA polymerase sigma factor n=1 Tax=Agaribacillus aureus TaxID=3051825 RepID=A0ABT8L5S1_9BACT|nr:sigma-70 family RNA polymerase sigma factor [Fulvivirgaceae bacterium BMA12]
MLEIRETSFGDSKKDEIIWNAFKNGDKQAYATLYQRYFKMLLQYSLKVYHDSDLAKDCIHDLFVEMWKCRANLTEPSSVKAYLLKAIRRKLVRHINKFRLKQQEPDASRPLEVVYCREEQIIEEQIKQERKTDVNRALNTLTRRQKEAVYLKFYLNLSYKEIAETMAININSIYNLISKAIDILHEEIRKTEKMRI